MLTRTGSFKALLDDGQASAELSALRDKVATLSEVSSAQAAFFRESRSSQQVVRCSWELISLRVVGP